MTKILSAFLSIFARTQPLLLPLIQTLLKKYGSTLVFFILCLMGFERANSKQQVQIQTLKNKKHHLQQLLKESQQRIDYKQALLKHAETPSFTEHMLIKHLGMVPKNGLRIMDSDSHD